MNGLVFDPLVPPPLLVALGLLLGAGTAFVYLRVGRRVGPAANLALLACRLVAVALILLLLLQPSRRQETPEQKTDKVLLVGLDTSRSMKQQDANHLARLDSARQSLREAKLLEPGAHARFFRFDSDAAPLALEEVESAQAEGVTTNVHRSVASMLNTLSGRERASGLLLLTDGHDFELVNPRKTAGLARNQRVPIFAVPFGDQGLVRDASVSLTNFEPYSYARQKAQISGSVRLIGCEHETLTVQLLRKGQVVQSLQMNTGEQRELPVSFEVSEPTAGQYEYEIRVLPLPQEADAKNNSAITFLNVIDQRIRVLLLEGAPYWDTTFLRRSLAGNDKIELDAYVQYTRDKARQIRNVAPLPGRKEGEVPKTQKEFNAYDLIILGKAVDPFFNAEQYPMLVSFVKDHGGALIFARGQAFNGKLAAQTELDPFTWGERASDHVRFEVGREGRLLSPFRVLAEEGGGVAGLPELLAARQVGDRKALAALLGQAHGAGSEEALPAMVQRRVGRGQVLSIAVDGLWRWSFNPKAAAVNNVFDRFWDQLVLWLVAGGDSTPSQPYSFRASTANLVLGAKMHFRLSIRDPEHAPKEVPVAIFAEEKPILQTALTAQDATDSAHLTADFLPEKPGRYRAMATLPGGQQQEVKWIVFEDNPEEKEVAADVPYLSELCESSGGRVLLPAQLAKFAAGLQERDAEPHTKVRLTSVWDRAWIFYVICGALALDWYLRRKLGLC